MVSHTALQPKQSLTHPQIAGEWMGRPYIDTLYDYAQFIRDGDESQHAGNSIASLPEAHWNTPVAIIRAGPAGLVAAYELLKIGASPVVFEVDPQRLGGRVYALPFRDAHGNPDPTTFAEMGAMRFPPSSRLLFHYVNNVFGLQTTRAFPNLGKVPTKLYYENSVIDWPAGHPCPPGFEDTYNDWQNFTARLISPLSHALQNHDMDQVIAIWQSYIDQYKDLSFYSAIRRGIPWWTEQDMNKFGALGIGSGGFGPLYPVGFLEILRIVINMMEQDQQLLVDGSSALISPCPTLLINSPKVRTHCGGGSWRCLELISFSPSAYNFWTPLASNLYSWTLFASKGPKSHVFSVVAASVKSSFCGQTLPPLTDNL